MRFLSVNNSVLIRRLAKSTYFFSTFNPLWSIEVEANRDTYAIRKGAKSR